MRVRYLTISRRNQSCHSKPRSQTPRFLSISSPKLHHGRPRSLNQRDLRASELHLATYPAPRGDRSTINLRDLRASELHLATYPAPRGYRSTTLSSPQLYPVSLGNLDGCYNLINHGPLLLPCVSRTHSFGNWDECHINIDSSPHLLAHPSRTLSQTSRTHSLGNWDDCYNHIDSSPHLLAHPSRTLSQTSCTHSLRNLDVCCNHVNPNRDLLPHASRTLSRLLLPPTPGACFNFDVPPPRYTSCPSSLPSSWNQFS